MPQKRRLDHAEMYEYYLTKKTLKEVGEKFGLTRERIRQIFEKESYKQREHRILGNSLHKKYIDVGDTRFYWNPNVSTAQAYSCSQYGVGHITLQRFLWKKYYGVECPKHYKVVFKDKNPKNIKKSNLELVDLGKIHAIVSPAKAKKLISAYASKKYTGYKAIGLEHGVSAMTVWKVVNRIGYYGRI